MGTKYRQKAWKHEKIPNDSYDNDRDDDFEDFDDFADISKDFYSTEWEDPSGSERRFSTRRKIERRNDLKNMLTEFVDWDDIDLRNEFDLKNDW